MRQAEVLDLTAELVRIDSRNPGPGEREMAGFIAAWCADRGIVTRVIEVVPGRPNLVATVDCGPGPRLGLSGHLDTKPIGEARAQWRTDPLELTIDGERAYGLGTSDMKGALAAMMLAADAHARSGRPGTVTLVFTADEEQGSESGSKALVRSAQLPSLDAIVVGEPSGIQRSWESLFLVSRGLCCFEIEIQTLQGHSGLSGSLGPNAIMVAADVIAALGTFQPPIDRPGLVAASPTVNPAIRIEGGVGYGVWPGRCVVAAEIRTVPGMEEERTRAAIVDCVRGAVGTHGEVQVRFAAGSQGWMPPTELDPRDALVGAARVAASRALGRELAPAAYPGGTDATYLMGEAGIPTITSLGPGLLSVAHGANEFVPITDLDDALALYSALIAEYLGGGRP